MGILVGQSGLGTVLALTGRVVLGRSLSLSQFDYRGYHRYLVTICAGQLRDVFVSEPVVTPLALEILRTCLSRDFEVLAYTFMPDHLHLLVAGRSDGSDFRALIRALKQRTSAAFGRGRNTPLWQDGYSEQVLGADEDMRPFIDHMLANPIRCGLVQRAGDYPFSWGAAIV